MSEVFGVLGLEALTGVLLGAGLYLVCVPLALPHYRTRLWKASLCAGTSLCFVWANFILGVSLVPRYVHGSATHPQAGMARDGNYYVVDHLERRARVSEREFNSRLGYEQLSSWLPWLITPPALLVLLLCYPRNRDAGPSGTVEMPATG